MLSKIQQEIKVPKGQINDYSHYKYRSCEDILEAVKPHLGDATITLSDEVIMIGDRYYVKATAYYKPAKGSDEAPESVDAYAREELTKKGMDEAQITGAASSYARKYALNGLLCIDDTKDADHAEPEKAKAKPKDKPKPEAFVGRMVTAFSKLGIDPKDARFYEWLRINLDCKEGCASSVVAVALAASKRKGASLELLVGRYEEECNINQETK